MGTEMYSFMIMRSTTVAAVRSGTRAAAIGNNFLMKVLLYCTRPLSQLEGYC